MTKAYLAVRSPMVHPILFENFVSASDMNSCHVVRISTDSYILVDDRVYHDSNDTHDIVALDPVRFSPGTHHPRVVECNSNYEVYPFSFEVLQMIDEAGKMAN